MHLGPDQRDHVAHGLQIFGVPVRYLYAEFVLQRHDGVDNVVTGGREIVDEAGGLGDPVGRDVELGNDHIANSVGNIAHVEHPAVSTMGKSPALSVATRLLAMVWADPLSCDGSVAPATCAVPAHGHSPRPIH